jgi:glycosyltransferase involved in cell wall biosynthesis
LRSSINLLAKHLQNQKIIIIGLGESAPAERSGQVEILFIPYQNDPKIVASYYQAADVFIHAACADTFPTSILESLACGTPVVATAVGGIPEQISDGETGFLVRPGDAQAMAVGVERMLEDDDLRQRMGRAAVDSAHLRFDLARAANDYLTWYDRIK